MVPAVRTCSCFALFYKFLVALRFRPPALWFENRVALGHVLSDDAGSLQPDGGVLAGIRSDSDNLDGGRRKKRPNLGAGAQITGSVSCVFSILLALSFNRTIEMQTLSY